MRFVETYNKILSLNLDLFLEAQDFASLLQTLSYYRSLSTWNVWICFILICLCFCGCAFLNTFIAVSLRKKQAVSSNYKILFMGSLTSLFFYIILLPTTLAGVADAKNVISERYCYLQETFNFCVIIVSFFFASLSCLNRMIVVVTNKKNWCQRWKAFLTMLLLVFILVFVTTVPYFTLSDEDHGCHLWSSRIDDAMWIRIFIIIGFLIICIGVVIGSFAKIYHHVLQSIAKVTSHDINVISKSLPVTLAAEGGSMQASDCRPSDIVKKKANEEKLPESKREKVSNNEQSTVNGSSGAGCSTSGEYILSE